MIPTETTVQYIKITEIGVEDMIPILSTPGMTAVLAKKSYSNATLHLKLTHKAKAVKSNTQMTAANMIPMISMH